MTWDQRYRMLEEGEVVIETDEIQNDDGSWRAAVCIGERAPSPYYTSHRVYRRIKSDRMAFAATPYEARICPGIPTDCCDYGVISHETGKEICRVWDEADARLIADLLNWQAADDPTERAERIANRMGATFVPRTAR